MDIKFEGPALGEIGNAEIMPMAYDASKRLIGAVVDYQNLMVLYDCAIKLVRTKFDMINAEYRVHHQRNPIVQSRKFTGCLRSFYFRSTFCR